MAIVRQYGKPDLFITMTYNPKWEEIVSALKPGEIANDHPDLVTRVFVGKLQHLLDELLKKGIFGEVVATFMSLSGRREACPMHTFYSFCTLITNHEGPMSTTVWCLQSCLIRMHTPLFLRSLQVACCMAPVAPSTHSALAWLTAFVQKATLRPSQSTPPTPPAPNQHTAAGMMATHLSDKCAGSRTMHLD
jgi:hypothetical protein